MSSLYVWLAENDCSLDHTDPEDKAKGRPETHIVLANDADRCTCPPFERLDDETVVQVRNHPARRPYNDMPRYWRELLFPDNFREWDEPDHVGKLLTWEQQQNVWAHKRAGEAWADGELQTDEYTRLVASMEPLPDIEDVMAMMAVARAKARVHHIKPQPGVKAPPPDEQARAVTPAQLAEVQAKVDRLRAEFPDATPGHILRLLEGRR